MSAARKPWTAAVCSMFLNSWRLRRPMRLRHSKGASASSRSMLHRRFATPTEVRSLRARSVSPRSVRVRRRPAGRGRATRRKPSRGLTSWAALGTETPSSPARSVRVIQGQSDTRSRARFSAGFRKTGSRWSAMSHAAPLSGMSSGTVTRSGSASTGSSPPGSVRSRRVAQVDGSADPGRAPYPVARFGQDRLALQGEQGRDLGGREQPAGMPAPHVVGHEDEHRSGHRLVAQPPEPLSEARPVGGASLPDDADRLSIGKRHGGVHPHGPVPAEVYGKGDVGEEAGQVIYRGQGVEALHQAAPPLGGNGAGAHQLVEGRFLLLREPVQPLGGEVEPPGEG